MTAKKQAHNDNDVVITASGIHLVVPQRFHEGHTLTAAEAAAFSAFFNTRVAGSATSNIERGNALDGKSEDEARVWLSDYYQNYKFDEPRTLQTVGSVKRDLAAEYISDRLTKAGKAVPTGDAMTAWVDGALADATHGANINTMFDSWLATREKRAAKAAKAGAVAVDLGSL